MNPQDFIPFLIVGAIILLVVLAIVVSILGERKRRSALAAVADELGLTYADDGSAMLTQLADLPLFSHGRSKRITNLIHGDTDDVAMGIFDYRYTVGSGKNAHTYQQTVVLVRSPQLQFPQFELKPQGFFHGIGKLLGYQDIDFESHPRFSKAFVLRGTAEKAIRRLFTPEVLSFCETKSHIHVEAQGHDLIFYRASQRAKPHQFRELMKEGFAVFAYFRAAASKSSDNPTV